MEELNQPFIVLLGFILASARIWISIVAEDKLQKLPITAKMGSRGKRIHKFGLYMSIGYVLLFAPQVILA